MLDLKSHYSIKKAFGSPETVVEKVKSLGLNYAGLTDYHSVSGCVSFVKACKEAGIKPILGSTLSLKEDGKLIVLCRNLQGWKDLIKIISLSYSRYYDKVNSIPYVPLEELCKYENFIFVAGFPEDIISRRIFGKTVSHLTKEELVESIELDPLSQIKLLGSSLPNLYLGISQNKSAYVDWWNQVARDSGLPTVILGNSHYPNKEDHEVFRVLLCASLKTTKERYKRVCLEQAQDLVKFDENTWEISLDGFSKEDLDNTQKLADSIESYEILSSPRLPKYDCPNKLEPIEYLKELCRDGWRKLLIPSGKLKEKQQEYLDRIKYELSVIEECGLASYFLIMADIMKWTKSQGWMVGLSRGCLSGDTEILIDGGYKPLKDIEVGDYVITKSGNSNKVLNKFKYDISEELLKITPMFGDFNSITLTKDHKCLAIKRNRYKSSEKTYYKQFKYTPTWIEAKDLETGDLLCQPKIKTKDINRIFDLSKYCMTQPNGTKIYLDGNDICYYKTANKYSNSCIMKSPKYIKLNKDFAYVLGVFTGDGWVCSGGGRTNSTCFCFHSINNLESQNRVDLFMRSVGCKVNYTLGQNGKLVNQLHFVNGTISRLFRDIFPDYKYKPDTKSVPECIMNSSKEVILEYLHGLINSDGSISGGKITICSISKKMVYQIKNLCTQVAIPCSVRKEDRTDTREGFKNRKRAYYACMPDFINGTKIRMYYDDERYIYTSIRKIEPINNVKEVYDIEVENEHSYTTACGIVHNSAGGCLISYLTGITKIDPVEYGLLFSRFFSASRKGSLPDIDSDFPASKRQFVIDYIRQKYGEDRVCHMVTFSEFKGASAIKEVLRVYDVCSFDVMNEITKAIPEEGKIADQMEALGEDSILGFTLKYQSDKLKDWVTYENDKLTGDYAKWFDLAIRLEGTIQGTGKHASAIVVFEEPLSNVCPMISDKSSEYALAGVDMKAAEGLGLVKLDVLGLACLDCLMTAQDLIKSRKTYYASYSKC